MAVTADQFRQNFPEFASEAQYPPAVVNFWLDVADKMLSPNRWGRMRDLGLQLFAAHNLFLERQAMNTAGNGGVPGANTGPVSQKSVGPGSISYDTQASVSENAGHWNMSTYGTRIWSMMQIFGAGPLIVGVSASPPFNTGAWPGPAPWPLPSGTGFSS